MSAEPVFGLLNINKPAGPTSHDIVARVRRLIGLKKIGHAGTLDPLASGVLVLCLGPATRLSEYVMRGTKQYRAQVRLGIETDTYDAEGQVVAEYPLGALTCAQVEAALTAFKGDISQVPPMYSAVKQGGKKLYELARSGQDAERVARPVTIHALDLIACDLPDVTLDITCSPGTYIRSLAFDLGRALGVGGYLSALERTASGGFRVADAVSMDDFEAAVVEGSWRELLLPPQRALTGVPALHLKAGEEMTRVQNGNPIQVPLDTAGEIAVFNPDGVLLALGEATDGMFRPTRVFPPAR